MRLQRIWVAMGLVAAGLLVTPAATQAGGPPDLAITVHVFGTEALNIESWVPEVFVAGSDEYEPGGVVACYPSSVVGEPLDAMMQHSCYENNEGNGVDVTLGFPTPIPAGYSLSASCVSSGDREAFVTTDTSFTIIAGDLTSCTIELYSSMFAIDKTIEQDENDPIDNGDVPLELWSEGTLVGEFVDSDPDGCGSLTDLAEGVCYYQDVVPGSYVVGEESPFGFLPADVECFVVETPGGPIEGTEQLLAQSAAFDVFAESPGLTYCNLLNVEVFASLVVTNTVINDDGGTATVDDFTIEIYNADDVVVPIASGVCDANTGVCLDGDFPVGDYLLGQEGPDGYTITSITVSQTELGNAELIDSEDAAFTLDPEHSTTVEVVNDDDAPPATTTTTTTTTEVPTTTTTAPATTMAPTTAAAITTTTAFDSAGITLPSTGGGQQSTLALAALMLLLLGGGAIALARREN